MKTIIVPTDFSPVALNALHYALDMARLAAGAYFIEVVTGNQRKSLSFVKVSN